MEASDEQLAERAAAGKLDAFEQLVARHHDRFYRIVYRMLLSREDAEDMVQDAFLKLWTGRARYNQDSKARFTSWFTQILLNQARDELRKRQKRRAKSLDDVVLSVDAVQASTLEDKQNADAVTNALAALPDRQRMAIALYYYGEMSQKEAASALKLSTKALESLLSRAKASLRQLMEQRHAG